MPNRLFEYRILQTGSLPLLPDGRRVPFVDHACTVTLIWPVKEPLSRESSLVVDPCFTAKGFRRAQRRLADLKSSVEDIDRYFITHEHLDHLFQWPEEMEAPVWRRVEAPSIGPGIESVYCPGHAPDLHALRFNHEFGDIWVVGDAILNREWLMAWNYYWPNGYLMPAIVETWKSIARILAEADVVIPGHGAAFEVTGSLLERLITGFSNARFAEHCPEVRCQLEERLNTLRLA